MSEPMAVPENIRALIGVNEEATVTIDARRFQQWASAVGDMNPLYFDEDFARAQGYAALVAPPMYLGYATSRPAGIAELREDGTRKNRVAYGPLPDDAPLPLRRMAGGEERWFYAPVLAGDVITSRRTIENVEKKTGRSGDFYLITWVGEDRNQQGELVGRAVYKMIAR